MRIGEYHAKGYGYERSVRMPEEIAQYGWCKLAELVGKSPRSCMRRKKKLKAAGVIHYTVRENAHGNRYKAMFFFPSLVKAFLVRASMEDENF